MPEALELARWQFGIITVYHFLFVPITIGLTWIVAWFQTKWMRTGDADYLRLTRFFGIQARAASRTTTIGIRHPSYRDAASIAAARRICSSSPSQPSRWARVTSARIDQPGRPKTAQHCERDGCERKGGDSAGSLWEPAGSGIRNPLPN